MNYKITHLHAPPLGGVTDYIDVAINNSKNFIKLEVNKNIKFNNSITKIYVLHYSGYGFSKRGAPLWLLNKLNNKRKNINTLGVFFHELYASGPPSSSAFWLSPVQRYIARQLAETSDFWITNREGSAQWLRRFAGDKPHAVLPVFSNVGEVSAYSSKRLPRIVVFGSAALRSATYKAAGKTLFSWAREQNFELHDIGPDINDSALSAAMKNENVIQHGRLESNEVSKLLVEAMFGIVAYPLDYAAKSGVLAAYCAHGICPVLISKSKEPADGLIAGTNFLADIPLKLIPQTIVNNIGSAAWKWYQPHRIMKHVKTLERLLKEATIKC